MSGTLHLNVLKYRNFRLILIILKFHCVESLKHKCIEYKQSLIHLSLVKANVLAWNYFTKDMTGMNHCLIELLNLVMVIIYILYKI